MVGHRGAHRLDVFDKVTAVNLTGTFNVLGEGGWRMRELAPLGPDGERGVMITISSIAAFDGVDGGVAYSASKGVGRRHDIAARAGPVRLWKGLDQRPVSIVDPSPPHLNFDPAYRIAWVHDQDHVAAGADVGLPIRSDSRDRVGARSQ